MANQRMAGGNEFQQKMQSAAKTPGGQDHKTKPASLIGADAWDRQVSRESQQFDNAAVSGSRGAENIAAYANVSKSATAANGDFSIDQGNKWVNNSREQSQTNKENDKGFAEARRDENVQFTQNVREDTTKKASEFANQNVQKYIQLNKDNQVVDLQALDNQIRKAPLYDKAQSEIHGLYTYGDKYRNSRENLPVWNMPTPMKGVKDPDIPGLTDKYMDRIDETGDKYMDKLG